MWKAGLALFSLLVVVVISKIYIYQTHDYFKSIRLGSINDILSFGLAAALVCSMFEWLMHRLLDQLCQQYYIDLSKYTSPQKISERCHAIVLWSYSSVFLLASSAWCYCIMRETTYFPSWLGGRGDPLTFLTSKIALHEATFEMKAFYMVQFGKHFSRFIGHIFIRSDGPYFQYALHHGLSVFLIVFSYLSNLWWIGLMVLLLHDYSDFAIVMVRIYRVIFAQQKDYRYRSKLVLYGLYIHALVVWIGLRVVLFVWTCIYPSIKAILMGFPNNDEQFHLQVMTYPYYFMAFMMLMLEVLHLFWTYSIIKSFLSACHQPSSTRQNQD